MNPRRDENDRLHHRADARGLLRRRDHGADAGRVGRGQTSRDAQQTEPMNSKGAARAGLLLIVICMNTLFGTSQ